MEAQTLVFVGQTQYLVAESIEEVKERWIAAQNAQLNDTGAVVELTNVNGYFDPYPVILNPAAIIHAEQAQPLQIRYSAVKTRERYEESAKEIDGASVGFGW